MSEAAEAAQLLEDICRHAAARRIQAPPQSFASSLNEILSNSETNRGVLAVLVTLLVKKLISPQQDIRLHQASMPGGFSGRGLDERAVTPFLKQHNFPAMQSGSGWLTRSLEQARPYDKDYPGKIKPPAVKEAFLKLVDGIQSGKVNARKTLICIFSELSAQRDKNTAIRLPRPTNLTILQITDRLRRHFDAKERGAARLPVLAVYAVYQQMIKEMLRYEGCLLLPLESHTSADKKTGLLGDIQVAGKNHLPVEAVEIKHNIRITPALVRDCYAKFRSTSVKTFYLLSTDSNISEMTKIQEIAAHIRSQHGCQLIVNGVLETLMYYLRLMRDTSAFIDAYVTLVETDSAVNYNLKQQWEKS